MLFSACSQSADCSVLNSCMVPAAGNSGSEPDAKKALAAGDSLAAMEAFTKLAAKREEERVEQEARMPLLNETSFDRRRTVAVYKQDGSRGHHMQVIMHAHSLS